MAEEKIVVPDSVTPIIGWRFWKTRQVLRLNKEDFFLRSVAVCFEWPEKEKIEAKCFCVSEKDHTFYHSRGKCPDPGSHCGIYAYKSLDCAIKDFRGELMLRSRADNYHQNYFGTLLGKVYLWGKIQKHQFGFRAQFAYPCSIDFAVCGGCGRIFFASDSNLVFRVTKVAEKTMIGKMEIVEQIYEYCYSYESEFLCFDCWEKLGDIIEGRFKLKLVPEPALPILKSLKLQYDIV